MKPLLNHCSFQRLLLSLVLFNYCACSYLGFEQTPDETSVVESDGEPDALATPDPGTARVEIISGDELKAASTLSDIEILWQIPQEAVDGFVINYGFERSALNHNARVATAELQKYQDPKHGQVYRFVLANVPIDQALYVSIAAYSDDKVSRASDVFEVKAGMP